MRILNNRDDDIDNGLKELDKIPIEKWTTKEFIEHSSLCEERIERISINSKRNKEFGD